jgi:hypothetical protein
MISKKNGTIFKKKQKKMFSRTTEKNKGKQEEVQDLSQSHRPWKA